MRIDTGMLSIKKSSVDVTRDGDVNNASTKITKLYDLIE